LALSLLKQKFRLRIRLDISLIFHNIGDNQYTTKASLILSYISEGYIINDGEAKVVKIIYNLCAEKQYSLRDIMIELRSMGATNKKGKPFTL